MNSAHSIELALEDLLAELTFARRNEELGRLALLAYCDVKRWARLAGESDIADLALRMFSEQPSASKEDFLQGMDRLIGSLQRHGNHW